MTLTTEQLDYLRTRWVDAQSPGLTHFPGCDGAHPGCAMAALLAEVTRLTKERQHIERWRVKSSVDVLGMMTEITRLQAECAQLVRDVEHGMQHLADVEAERDQLRDQFRQIQTDYAHQSIRMEQQRDVNRRLRALLIEAAAWHEHWPDPVHCERCPRLRTGLDTARGGPG